jgi:uncharacterized repeat protein (TIGR01451 family)
VCAEGDPDAFVTKTATLPTVIAGGIASYTITVTAGGDANSTNVELTDVLPTGFSWTLGGADAGACSPGPPGPIAGTTTLTCSFGTMASGTSKTITVSTQTSASRCPAGVMITNTATLTAHGDSNPGNNSSGPVTITVKCPDVSVVKTTTTPTITAGAGATYKVVVTANGSSDSMNVVLTDPLPAGLTWTVGGPDAGACSPGSPVTGGNTLTCAFGTMAQNTTKTITLTATTSATSCPAINNTASVSSDGDTNSSNNTSGPVKITVSCADVKVVKTTTTPAIAAGDQASYSVVVTANGPGTSTNVTLSDTLPAGLNWTVGGQDAGACSPASPVTGGTTLTCGFGSVAQGTTKTITLSAVTTAANCSAINNTASVSATGDANSSNNTSGPIRITVNCPDVSVNKTTTTPTMSAGGTASYTVTVTAGGTGSSSNVVLTDTLPSGLIWTVGGANAASCSPASPVAGGTTLTCNFGTLGQGSTRAITVGAVTTAASCPAIYNTAGVGATVDGNSNNNSSGPVKITVNCADVRVTKTTTTPTISAGGIAGYTVTVTAGGTGSSSNVVLTDTLPSGLGWTVGGVSAASCSPASPVAGGTTLTCNFGTLAQASTRTITLTATTDATSCPSISNTATVSASIDGGTTNNTTGPVVIAVNGCAVTRGKTVGFWRNVNGHAILDPGGEGNIDTPMSIGGATRGFRATTTAQSDKILGNGVCEPGSPAIFLTPCSLSAGLGVNTLENLAGQTLALTYNIGRIAGYTSHTISTLGCVNKLTSALTSAPLSLSPNSSVSNVLAAANKLINGSKSGGTTTQTQTAEMNGLLGGCINAE